MAGYGRGRAKGYSDYYKDNDNSLEDEEDTPPMKKRPSFSISISTDVPDTREERRKAIKRRLNKGKVGK